MSVDTLFYSKGVYKVVELWGKCVGISKPWLNQLNGPGKKRLVCPTGLCGHGKSMARAGVNSLLIPSSQSTYGEMFEITPRDV